MRPQTEISENSRRIAKNTLFLYFRMLLLMLAGLFTTRIVLRTLGFDDYGLYGTVGSVVALGNILAASVAQALSRYIAAGLQEGDRKKSESIFSTGVIVMASLSALVVLLVESLGIWYVNNYLNLPPDRLEAAHWVLHCSLGVLVLSLLSLPFNASIMAHEKMSAYAFISILEGVLKLGVAVGLVFVGFDKLKVYSLLMLAVAFVIRLTYSIYCRRNFAETCCRLHFDKPLFKEMLGFAGWNFLGSGAYLLNTQGVNLAVNFFFGVALNAARGVAGQIENILRQFISNIVLAVNPQITKQYVAGNKAYAFELVNKGAKYAGIIVLFFMVPYVFEADRISLLLFGRNPAGTGLFSVLSMACLLMDLAFNTLVTLELATGEIRRYYLVTSAISVLVLPVTCAAFMLGAPAWTPYVVFVLVYVAVDAARLLIVRSQTGFPIGKFFREAVLKVLCTGAASLSFTLIVWILVPDGWWRLAAVLTAATAATSAAAYSFALTEGERAFLKSKIMAIFAR
ncbi:MAG: lipopolysaccharide biosynthesis protein [Bacteroidales bacterium]|nr:lipopolysaccharide biosynthesis protein [Bacteroidales bacterium]